jgi:hypothetical protein
VVFGLFDLGYLLRRLMLQADGQATDGSAYATDSLAKAGNTSTVTALWCRIEIAL